MMHFADTKIKKEHRVFDASPRRANTGDDMSLGGITVVITLASLIGLWGITCLVSGLCEGGGIIGLAASWISAVFGF